MADQKKQFSQNEEPLVSVITPCLNAEDTISDTLNSVAKAADLLGDSGWTLEHLIIDGGSRDRTHNIIMQHTEKNKDCRASIYQCQWWIAPNEGVYESMNAGLAIAKGYFSHVINADDFLISPKRYTAALMRAHAQGARILLSSIIYFRRPGPRWKHTWQVPPIPNDEWLWQRQLLSGLHYPHPGFIAKTDIYRGEGFDKNYRVSADYKLMQSLLLRQGSHKHVYSCETPLVAMAMGGVSGTWRGMIEGYHQLRAINCELGIQASAIQRYWSKLKMRRQRLFDPFSQTKR